MQVSIKKVPVVKSLVVSGLLTGMGSKTYRVVHSDAAIDHVVFSATVRLL
jgi:hypothetical protein